MCLQVQVGRVVVIAEQSVFSHDLVIIVDFIVPLVHYIPYIYYYCNTTASCAGILITGRSRSCTRKVVGRGDLECIPSPLRWSALLLTLRGTLRARSNIVIACRFNCVSYWLYRWHLDVNVDVNTTYLQKGARRDQDDSLCQDA